VSRHEIGDSAVLASSRQFFSAAYCRDTLLGSLIASTRACSYRMAPIEHLSRAFTFIDRKCTLSGPSPTSWLLLASSGKSAPVITSKTPGCAKALAQLIRTGRLVVDSGSYLYLTSSRDGIMIGRPPPTVASRTSPQGREQPSAGDCEDYFSHNNLEG
jgi:hypothetical protein